MDKGETLSVSFSSLCCNNNSSDRSCVRGVDNSILTTMKTFHQVELEGDYGIIFQFVKLSFLCSDNLYSIV